MAGGAAFRQWGQLIKEVTYGTLQAVGGLTEGTDFIWPRMVGDDPFTGRPAPEYWTVRSADVQNRRAQTGTSFYGVKGTMKTLFYPSRAGFLLDAVLALSSFDLTSYSFVYYDSQQTWQFLGGKVDKATLTFDTQAQLGTLDLDWTFQKGLGGQAALAAPTIANFPAESAYTLNDSAGLCKLNNAVRVDYSKVVLTVDNLLIPTRNELGYISHCYWGGRDIDFMMRGEYEATTDRAAFNAGTVQSTNVLKWVKGSNSVTLTLPTAYIKDVSDELPLGGAAYQGLGKVEVYYDRTSAGDLTYTVV